MTSPAPDGPPDAPTDEPPDEPAAPPRRPRARANPGARRDEDPDDRQPSDNISQFESTVEDFLRSWAESERGRQSLRGVRGNSGAVGMGDDSIAVNGSVGAIYQFTGQRAEPGRPLRVSPAELLTLAAVLVPSDSGGESSRSRLVGQLRVGGKEGGRGIVAGRAGSGRTSVALCALADMLPAGSRLATVRPGPGLLDLDAECFASYEGFVVDLGDQPDGDSDLDTVVSRVDGWVEKHGAAVVIICTETMGAQWADQFAVVQHVAPDRRQVFDSLLRGREGISDTRIADLPDSLLAASAGRSLTGVSLVAELVARALREDRQPEFYLDGHVRRSVREKLRAPLAEPEDERRPVRARNWRLFRRSFLIALAVGNGLPLDTITEQAISLAGTLAGRGGDARRWSLHFEATDELLTWADAVATDGEGAGADARARLGSGAGGVRFGYPDLPAIVLDTVWDEHHLLREPLLRWLGDLAVTGAGGPRARPMWLRSAQAVGHVAARDFDRVMVDVIEPWISESLAGQRAAARAIEAMTDNPATADQAWECVGRWSGADRDHRMTALFAYGALQSPERVPEALEFARSAVELGAGVLARTGTRKGAARVEHFAVASVLHSAAAVGCVDRVVEVLSGWLAEVEPGAAPGGGRAGPAARVSSWGRVPVSLLPRNIAHCWLLLVGDGRVDGSRRRLLAHFEDADLPADLFERLWRLALSCQGPAPSAWRLLRTWLEEGTADPLQSAALGRLLRYLAWRSDLAWQVRFYVRMWREAWVRSGRHAEASRLVLDVFPE